MERLLSGWGETEFNNNVVQFEEIENESTKMKKLSHWSNIWKGKENIMLLVVQI